MNLRIILKVLGLFTAVVGLFMLLPLAWALADGGRAVLPLAAAMGVTVASGGALFLAFRSERGEIYRREGMLIVTFTWVLAAFFGALPFHFASLEAFPTFTDCYFESMSGFTTTGASILRDIEAVPRGLLFWRSLTHWLGGMGIIVLFIAVLPFLGLGGRELYRNEVPGPTPEGLRPRIVQTARLLYGIYLFLTAAEVLLLRLAGMTWFDALCHTFGTLATGGFSTRNASIAAYASPWIDGIVIAFMIVAGVNFSLFYEGFKGRWRAFVRNPEFRVYAALLTGTALLVTGVLWVTGTFGTMAGAFRYGAFQTVSILTTTGYATADFDQWPPFLRVLLVLLMFVGGCAGSTGGGMKVVRLMVLFKDALRAVRRDIHPHVVYTIRVGRQVVRDDTAASIRGYFILFLGIFFTGSAAMAAFGLEPLTALTSVAATMGNIGPGLAGVGPVMNYAFIPAGGKWLLSFFMLIGRLELFTVLVLLLPTFWRD